MENRILKKIKKIFITGGLIIVFLSGTIHLARFGIHSFSELRHSKSNADKDFEIASHYGFRFLSDYEDCLEDIRDRFGSDSIRNIIQKARIIKNEHSLDYPDVELPQITFLAPYQGYLALTTLQFSPITRQLDSIEHKINISSKHDFFYTFTYFYNKLTYEYGPADKFIESLHLQNSQNDLLRIMRRWWKVKNKNQRIILIGEYCGNENGCGGVFIFDSIADIPLKNKISLPADPKEVSLTFDQIAQPDLSKKETDRFIEEAKQK